jgi:preprotein translocase subunit SecG
MFWFNLLIVLIIIVCILLVLIVLVQNSKGGGLAAGFQSSNQIMGVRRTADFLEKATWTLAGALVVLSILAGSALKGGNEKRSAVNSEATEQEAPATNKTPATNNQPASNPVPNK